MIYDFCVVGGGIVGFATAMQLLQLHPGASLLLLEKENSPGLHQTGHNSGVIHAGIYYAPGSLKAQLCRDGLNASKAFCRDHGLPFEECGKLIVATNDIERERIDALYARAHANGLSLERIDGEELRRREPNISGVAALYSPETAITDFAAMCRKMAELVAEQGGEVHYGITVDSIAEKDAHVEIGAEGNSWRAKKFVACAGAQSDRLAALAGLDVDFRIVPFRGEYFQLPPEKNHIVKHLIYPAPDPSLPFLGIHLTRMIDGSVTVGPNAVIGFAREGYQKSSFNLRDSLDFAAYPGFWKLILQYRHHALHELRGSLSRRAYLAECRKYCASLELDDLQPYRTGVRAQAVSREGAAIHDFLIKETKRMLHVCNAPSPAATSAIPIGAMIAQKCGELPG
ncbi:L-2-hydroxyglutarate oxidase [Acidithiobacillus sp.]|jgi:L-2-hydroxyglutarate oxidase|uniref:L-2-hydroxyglutarate oxidase n=1 Tax=Acidithiobacillus sp. TaxID=1872118 RepID=UPI0025C0F341|nr:L-2-hydroxyglutarate oxidase [Acidithiobacillus sp.]MCK9187981.1 L-2-hydroxyglutarate oxidase [Acidithiobacillus sp.]MCK9359941.1 L-2-hydroxyglutarate oxidase [Acidithiobacillus sp.]